MYNEVIEAQAAKNNEIARAAEELTKKSQTHLDIVSEKDEKLAKMEADLARVQKELRALEISKKETEALLKREQES